ncbi:MAG: hypothetical protein IJ730_03815, partial [Alphaproteobacteria bacterium]|nr:hypothetical protein [Alphaproteobacteria bacterium]
QNVTVSTWYNDNSDDSYATGSSPRYYAYVLLHNVYLKSVTQASGTKYIRTLRSTKKNDIKLVVDKRISSGFATWSSNTNSCYGRNGITYGNGRFIIVGGYNSSQTGAYYAVGSISYSYVSLSYSLACVAYDADDGYFYASTAAGAIYRTQDGSSWSSYNSSCPVTSGIERIACGNGRIVVQNTSGNYASLNKSSGNWNSGTTSYNMYGLCFGSGKFICMSTGTTSYVYSSTDGTSWSQIGTTTFDSAFTGAVCYGDGRFLAVSGDGLNINISTNGGSTWYRAYTFTSSFSVRDICYGYRGFIAIYNYNSCSGNNYYLWYLKTQSAAQYKSNRWQVKIGNRSAVQVTSRTTFNISSSELTQNGGYYYIDFDCDAGYGYVKAAISYNTTETVDDLIDFNSGSMSGKNGILSATGSTSYSNGYYRASGVSKVSTPHRGKLILKYGHALDNNSGNSSTSTVQKTSLTNSGGYYYYNWNYSTSYVLLNVKFEHEPTLWYPYTLTNSLVVDWRNNTVTVPSSLNLSSYSNYNTEYGYHQLKTSGCSPEIYRKYQTTYPYASDITAVLDTRASLLANITMPEVTNAGVTHLNGVTRLFSQQLRSSTSTLCKIEPNSTSYDQIASLISTNFTAPYNAVLFKSGYQSTDETPTHAVADVTAAACAKLKSDWGTNLRIYVVKYRAQENYASFPYYNKSSTSTAHDYTVVNNCATNGLVYSASNEADLKARLNEIAADIKSWAGYEAAKISN